MINQMLPDLIIQAIKILLLVLSVYVSFFIYRRWIAKILIRDLKIFLGSCIVYVILFLGMMMYCPFGFALFAILFIVVVCIMRFTYLLYQRCLYQEDVPVAPRQPSHHTASISPVSSVPSTEACLAELGWRKVTKRKYVGHFRISHQKSIHAELIQHDGRKWHLYLQNTPNLLHTTGEHALCFRRKDNRSWVHFLKGDDNPLMIIVAAQNYISSIMVQGA